MSPLPPYTLSDYRRSIEAMHLQSLHGCGNGGCLINPPKGQHTNAGCRCSSRDIARNLRRIADAVANAPYNWDPNG